MVELEHDLVRFAAIRAGVAGEVIDQVGRPFEPERLLSGARLIDVALLVRQVMGPVVRRSAGAAHVVALTACPPPPGELREPLRLAACSAPSALPGLCHHEHMFACASDQMASKMQPATGRGAVW